MNKISTLALASLFLLPLNGMSQVFKLSEQTLHDLSKKGAPQLEQIEAAFLSVSFNEHEVKQNYAPELFGRGAYIETRERPIIQFQPIFSPIKQAELGVRKNFASGFETSAYVRTDQRSARSNFVGKLQNVTTTTLAFTVQMDLWKNLLGHMSKAQLENVNLEKKRAQIEKDIQLRAFNISLRRVYWSLVANKVSTVISEQLEQTAKKQLKESQDRLRNSVAESDEVARYEAQLASRQGTILFLGYQKENLIKQLKNLAPELIPYEIELDAFDLAKSINDVMACTAQIGENPRIPYEHTRYDEMISMLKEVKSNNQKINDRYADPDVKLFGTVKSTGVGSDVITASHTRGSYGDSIEDQMEQNRTGYEVGANFTIPLGDAKENTQRVKELYDEKRLLASIHAADSQVITTHQQLSKTVSFLKSVIQAQKTSTEQLEKRLRLMRRKYEQARISVDELVNDQDALLTSQLTTIDTQLQILNTLFDYLVIYTETPCTFNRI